VVGNPPILGGNGSNDLFMHYSLVESAPMNLSLRDDIYGYDNDDDYHPLRQISCDSHSSLEYLDGGQCQIPTTSMIGNLEGLDQIR